MTAHWPPPKSDGSQRIINDNVHGVIVMFHPLECILDTEEMQRLRELKQLGLTHLVYPSATHTRFVHSLGAYWLAFKLVDSLRQGFESLNITSADHLCVSVASLCHDLGHGPLSHLFDGSFREEMGGLAPKHEQLSCELIGRIFEKDKVKAAFEPYFGKGKEWDKNILFIKELVHSTKFKDGKWQPRGRPIEKSFLHDVVANDNDSIDVDKWDYLLRDSLNTGVAIALNRNSIDRIIENSCVLFDDEKKIYRIGYAKKIAETLLQIGQARQQLHEAVYQHKLNMAVESMIVRSLTFASPYLKYQGDDGEWYPLSRVTENMGAYLKTNDSILSQIVYYSGDELKNARQIVEEIQMRKVPQRLDEECFSPVDKRNVIKALTGKADCRELEKVIRQKMINELDSDDHDFFLITRDSHRGMHSDDPMKKVLLHDSKGKGRPITACSQWLSLKVPESPVSWTLAVYVPRDMPLSISTKVRKSFDKVLVECGIRRHSKYDSARVEDM